MSLARAARAAALIVAAFASSAALAESNAPDPWPSLVTDIFHGREIAPADGTISLDAPKRAEDAAIVPMTMRFADPAKVKAATLVIDQNPMPMAASFTLGEKAGVDFIETRVRVNSYTNVHAVAETRDGKLHSEAEFVKASGGCSAPAGKDPDEALANMGKMKYREFRSAAAGRREAQIMIRHPNNSGMQMDQITRAYTPAHYVDAVEVWQGDELIFKMEGGISLSEDPNFRFSYAPNGAKTMRVVAHDNQGGVYKGEWPIAEPS
ncbi:quinoprotein dehydrogenase-associated SoxYZ-like carrier [Methylocystis parvus]|uniref:Quinoprotein dehydrogenase-associated SoxYZ-like carrier n=1 Tax=Methylocystis parvus TaxID=134 RepID=A0A6B8LZN1_9HYPH|nr:quinoprotein dehydrogenase-associated SoxYZ-like carrier [Methylocystis parvus]QGM96914.1 quinoprotein dehydrogenase-associated SoxYZ-like carrier [Methylocystis parvus]WBJ99200.1 quinoprotein dehydrogenase-associated SoxYZ-like carrier [Methylocystis parvus OBBP]